MGMAPSSPAFSRRSAMASTHRRMPLREASGVRGKQPDRACAEDGNRVAGSDVDDGNAVVAGGEGISEQDEIVFPIVAGLAWELEAIGIGERHAKQLRRAPWYPPLFG